MDEKKHGKNDKSCQKENVMRVAVIGAAGHIGTYLIPMLVDNGYETIAVTRTLSPPYEDAPAWHKVCLLYTSHKTDNRTVMPVPGPAGEKTVPDKPPVHPDTHVIRTVACDIC